MTYLFTRGNKQLRFTAAMIFFLAALLSIQWPTHAFLQPQPLLVARHTQFVTIPRSSDRCSRRIIVSPLLSTPDEDSEMIDENNLDGESEDFMYAPRSERENFVSEAEEAARANEMVATLNNDNNKNEAAIELQEEISNSFLQYALSIILGRAIPDARDGMKPVHRRILYAMDQLKLSQASSHRKCARVVGEVLGKFHPHGDLAVYDALVRMAQDFSSNHPLIDGHGNFGSVDADPAAAMRYTECRLTTLAEEALLGDDYNSAAGSENRIVDFVANFDGNEVEPTVLPAKVPMLLLNGASGIAVGMATNIPPHNLRELLNACTAMTKKRQKQQSLPDEELFRLIPGPDFPTGASILGTASSKTLYKTGHGGVKMRAITHVEDLNKKGGRKAIVVTELPYQVNKAALLQKMAALVNEKKLDGISDLRDESDRDGIRVVIELKRDAVAAVVLNNLYQKTPLQTSFSGNFLALMTKNDQDDNDLSETLVPQRFTLRKALDSFLDFRFQTIRRKAKFQLSKVEARMHIVDGLLTALTDIDKVIDLIRSAPDQAAARIALQKRLETSQLQTDAILRLQLGQLTRLNKGKLETEKEDLEKQQKELNELLQVDNTVYDYMLKEFDELNKKFGRDRKTIIIPEDEGDLSELDLIRNARSVIVVTRGGYIKRLPLKTFESQRRGTRGKRATTAGSSSSQTSQSKSEDEVAHCFTCHDHDTLLMVTQSGVAYGLRAYQIPTAGRTARGQPIPSVLPVITSNDAITTILPISDALLSDSENYLLLATENGWIKKTPMAAFDNLTGRGLICATLNDGDRLRWCQQVRDGDDILVGSSKGMATRFKASSVRPTGRTSRGVLAMKLKEGDTIADVNVLNCAPDGTAEDALTEYALVVTSKGFGKRIETNEFRTTSRGKVGVIAIKFKKTSGPDEHVSCLLTVNEKDEILVITAKGIMLRQKIVDIPVQSRSATGVTIQKLDAGDKILSVSIVPEYEETDLE